MYLTDKKYTNFEEYLKIIGQASCRASHYTCSLPLTALTGFPLLFFENRGKKQAKSGGNREKSGGKIGRNFVNREKLC